jgi:mono/diheme cytochrome c family protein
MKHSNWITALLALVVTAVLICACASGTGEEDAGESPGLSAAELSRAATLFENEGCPVCHGDSAQGVEDAGPALSGLAPYWDVEKLSAYLQDPMVFRQANPDFDERRDVEFMLEMPAYDALSKEQRELLAGWLMTR